MRIRKILLRRLLPAAAVVAVLFGALFALGGYFINAQFLATQISRLTGAVCAIDDVSLSLRGVVLNRVRLSTSNADAPFCAFEQVHLTFGAEIWRQLWRDRSVSFLALTADGVYFDVDRFQKFEQTFRDARADSATESSPIASQKKSPLAAVQWEIDRFVFRNLRVVIHNREIQFSEASGDWRDGKVPFTATGNVGNGKITATGNVVFSLVDRLMRARQIDTVLQVEDFPIDWAIDAFPTSFTFMQPRGEVSGKIELECDWGAVGDLLFIGQVKVKNTGVHLFGEDIALPLSDGEFSGTFSYASASLMLDTLSINGERTQFSMDGFIDYSAEKMVYRVASDGLEWRIICAIIGKPELADFADGLVNFTGTITSKEDEIEIHGEGGSTEIIPRFLALSPFGKLSTKTAISYNSREHTVWLRDLYLKTDLGTLAGEARFPYLTALNADNFACDLALAGELAPIGALVGIDAKGALIGKFIASVTGATENKIDVIGVKGQLEIKSSEDVIIRKADAEMNFGKISFAGQGVYAAEKLRVDKIQFSSLPLAAAIKAEYVDEQISASYSLRLRPPTWLAILNLPAKLSPERFGEIRAQGYVAGDAREINLQKTNVSGTLLHGEEIAWNYAVSGDASITPDRFVIHNGAAFLAQETETLLTADFSGGVDTTDENRSPKWDLSLRGNTCAAAEIGAYFGYKNLPTWDGETQLSAQITADEKSIADAKTAAASGDDSPPPKKWRAAITGKFSDVKIAEWLRPQTFSYETEMFAQGDILTTDEIKISADGVSAVASGTVSQSLIDVAAKVEIDGERAFAILQNPPSWRLIGNIPLTVKFSGTPASPEFSLNSTPSKITIASANVERMLAKPQLNFAGAFQRDDVGIHSLKISDASLKTADWNLQIAAQADRATFSDDTLDFGKGAAARFSFRAKRAALTWLFPTMSPYFDATKNFLDSEKSLTANGIARALKISLNSDKKDAAVKTDLRIDDGKFFIDGINIGAIPLRKIVFPFTYREQKFSADGGSADAGGVIDFNFSADFSETIPHGDIEIRADKIDLARCFGGRTETPKIERGFLSFPSAESSNKNSSQNFVRAEWRGADGNGIINSLVVADFPLQIDDLSVVILRQRVDWQDLLATDFHPTVAKGIADFLDQYLNRDVGSPQTVAISHAQVKSQIKDRTWLIAPAIIDGKNVPDFNVVGRLKFDRRLQARVLVRDNLTRQIDRDEIRNQPHVKTFLSSLPSDARRDAENLLPDWLNALARSRKLYFDVGGEIDNMQIDWRPTKKVVRDELPDLISRVIKIASQSAMVRDIIGKELNINAPATDGKPSGPLIDLDQLLK